MRQLRDREDVDEVEEQLDRGRRLRRCRRRAGAGGGSSAVTGPVELCGRRRGSGAARDRAALGRHGGGGAPAATGGLRGARGDGGRAGTASTATAASSPRTSAMTSRGTTTTTTRIASGGHTRSPMQDDGRRPRRRGARRRPRPRPPRPRRSVSLCWAAVMSSTFRSCLRSRLHRYRSIVLPNRRGRADRAPADLMVGRRPRSGTSVRGARARAGTQWRASRPPQAATRSAAASRIGCTVASGRETGRGSPSSPTRQMRRGRERWWCA